MERPSAEAYAHRWRATYRVGDRTVFGVSDGAFIMSEGFMSEPGYHHRYEDDTGVAALPVASFVVPGETTVLIDAGIGPRQMRSLTGGALLGELAAVGVDPADVDVLAISHLHLDHDGWIATSEGQATFPNATVRVGRADYRYFVEDEGSTIPERLRMAPALKEVLGAMWRSGRLVPVDDTEEVAPGVVALPAPGHTPGHLIFAIGDADERMMVLGDAMYCPAQLTDADLTALHDVDPVVARRSRESIQREMERHATTAVGCHFPGLSAARVLGGRAVPA
jgi:glyoxylase-like metal-dependent hydrolase (beta-lactamase superfamily II)